MKRSAKDEMDDVLSMMGTSKYISGKNDRELDDNMLEIDPKKKLSQTSTTIMIKKPINVDIYPQIESKRLRIISAVATQFKIDCSTAFPGSNGWLPHFEAWLFRSKFNEITNDNNS